MISTSAKVVFPGVEHLSATQLKEARRSAIQYLYQLDITQHLYTDAASERTFCEQFGVPPEQRSFLHALSTGVLARLGEIDSLIQQHSVNWKITRIAKVDLAIIRVCVLELLSRQDIALEMLLADAAEIGKQYGSENSSGFVNGVLDAIARGTKTST